MRVPGLPRALIPVAGVAVAVLAGIGTGRSFEGGETLWGEYYNGQATSSSSALGQQPTLVVENGRVITGEGTVLEEASVVVAGDSILSVTREPVEAPDARHIDASGKTVLPGLIDAHVHLTIPPDDQDSTALVEHLEERVPEILDGFLKHGVTTVRSTGDY